MKPKSFEEVRKELLVSKEIVEDALKRLSTLEEKESVTLQLAFYNKTIPHADLCVVEEGSLRVEAGSFKRWAVATKRTGLLAYKAFSLNDEYDWELGKDEEDALCLVPIKKEVKNKKKNIIGHFEPR